MKISAMELALALDLSESIGALEAIGHNNLATSLQTTLEALREQAWTEEAEQQHD